MSGIYLGLMSGTSVDSIDAALVDFSGDMPNLLATHNQPWPAEVREAILQTRELDDDALDTLQTLDIATANCFAEAANACIHRAGIDASQVEAIGSHGQTIRHRPDAATPFSLQIGDPQRIAELTGIDVIADFRRADIEAGGQGAPLVPAFHNAVFRSTEKNRVIVNIGGIANITILPKDPLLPVTGFDTGPGNTLMDAWTAQHRHQAFDRDGAFAASGRSDARLLANLLMDDYFRQPPPKSTGFETFNLDWLRAQLANHIDAADVQSTLCDLTAVSIMRAINQQAPDTDEMFVCGGGAHNTELTQRLQSLTALPVASTQQLGIDPDWVEAMTFAWLARQFKQALPGNIPQVTGAREAVVLGEITPH